MRASRKRKILALILVLLVIGVGVSVAVWRTLTYEPPFYRKLTQVDRKLRRVEADRFLNQTFQLRNDIANEGRWEASFTDEEVNAWLGEHLMTLFAGYVPDGVQDPLVSFDFDRVTLAFRLDRGPFQSLVWAVARVQVSGENTVALTIEKIRAGAMPISPHEVIEPIVRRAQAHGLGIDWTTRRGEPVVFVRYSPSPGRVDVVLERVVVLDGRLYISGRSDREAGRVSGLSLPSPRVLRMNILSRPGARSRRLDSHPST